MKLKDLYWKGHIKASTSLCCLHTKKSKKKNVMNNPWNIVSPLPTRVKQ